MTATLPARRATLAPALSMALLGIPLLVGLAIGPYDLSPGRIIGLLAARIECGLPASPEASVLFNIRLPRLAAPALVGAAPSSAGAAYKVTFRNPHVSQDIFGVSAGAGHGAVRGIFLGQPVLMIQAMGFAGGPVTMALVMAVAASVGRGDTLALVLCGIAIGALASAGISLLKVLADPEDQLPATTFWLQGILAGIKTDDVALAAPAILMDIVPLAYLRWRVGLLAMGEDEARAMGVEITRLRWLVIAYATPMTPAAVSLSGMIG